MLTKSPEPEIIPNITAVILTFNEGKHLERCIKSVRRVAEKIVVVDCFSNDQTTVIARKNGARVIQKKWVNHADQFNWALTQLAQNTQWVLRMDADEYMTEELVLELKRRTPNIPSDIDGVFLKRRIKFQGRLIQYGGVFPTKVLRLFRYGRGECENRWMDEHIRVKGDVTEFDGEIIDDNLNSLTWWIEKHNKYSSREVVDLLNADYDFLDTHTNIESESSKRIGLKRWLKYNIYNKLPFGVGALAYFLYRFVFRAGFLDGKPGITFHFFQGFWYRYLIDAKLAEVKNYMKRENAEIKVALKNILNVDI